MDSEEWKQLDKLLHGALQRPPEERDAFLRKACAGKEVLEHEARALLMLEHNAGEFLERPAIEMAAQTVVQERNDTHDEAGPFRAGATLSHYRMLEKLGGGGMGVVYKAEAVHRPRRIAVESICQHRFHNRPLS
jgi:eukaryotic-like serine/threonine-protein kinase